MEFLDNIQMEIEKRGIKPLPQDQKLKFEMDRFNSMLGNEKILKCELCNSKGIIAYIDDEEERIRYRECMCYNLRKNRERLLNLGLLDFVDNNNSFDSFIDKQEWQKAMKSRAIEYVSEDNDYWFFIGGQVGCGKTKLCVTILAKLMENEKYKSVEFLSWDGEFKDLIFRDEKGIKTDLYKKANLLYIDDFFRVSSQDNFKDIERDKAKEIIDYRYRNKLKTIISSELLYSEIESLDEAIASRIYEMSKKGYFKMSSKRDPSRNMRKVKDEEF